MPWTISLELSSDEQRVASRLTRGGKFYVFLRQVLSEFFCGISGRAGGGL